MSNGGVESSSEEVEESEKLREEEDELVVEFEFAFVAMLALK